MPDRVGLPRSPQYIFWLFPQTKVPAESFYLGHERDRLPLLNLEGLQTGYPDFDDLQELSRGCETSSIYHRPIVSQAFKPVDS
jgi:hypothetical protein